jgi:hypothetical protein
MHKHQTRLLFSSAKHHSFGGFPMPHQLISSAIHKHFPKLKRLTTRTITIPAMTSYISFNAIVGHNSAFHNLTEEQKEELGGVEYRALNLLLWFVGGMSSSNLAP